MPALPRILIVDDEENILRSLRRVLRKSGYEIDTTHLPAEAIRMVGETTYAVVVSDQRMPGITGTQVLEQVRLLSPDSTRIILTGYADVQAAMDAINKGAVYRYLNKPWDDDELRIVLRQATDKYLLIQENRRLSELTARQNAELADLNKNLQQRVAERTWEVLRLNQELEQRFMAAVRVIGRLGEMHSAHIGSHAKRVALLAREAARRLGVTGRELQQVEVAASLHDIGKIRLEASLLQKPEGQLTASERQRMREHPILGEGIIRLMPDLDEAATIVRAHHERFDGDGYPDGLGGEEIPLGARVIAAVNAFDKVLNPRTGFTAMTPAIALKVVQSRVPAEFDPKVVEVLAGMLHTKTHAAEIGNELEVSIEDLRPGMVLAQDLHTGRGRLLVRRNSMLLGDQIEQLHAAYHSDPFPEGIHIYRRWPLPG